MASKIVVQLATASHTASASACSRILVLEDHGLHRFEAYRYYTHAKNTHNQNYKQTRTYSC